MRSWAPWRGVMGVRFGDDDDGIEVEALESSFASDGQLIETGGPGRFRTLAIVLAGLALLGGVIAFAGRESNPTDDSSSDTRPTATTVGRSATSTTLDDGRPTTTTVPPTTTTLPSVIGPLLEQPSGLRIAVVDDKNRLFRIALDTGTVEALDKTRSEATFQVTAQGEWITWQGERGFHVVGPDGTEVFSTTNEVEGQALESDGTTFWAQRYSGRGSTSSIVQVAQPGGPEIGDPVELPLNAYVVGVVAGHPIVWVNGGGTYALGVDGAPPLRLGYGAPGALGGGAALLDECDELMRCTAVLVDVATGKRSEVAEPIGGVRTLFFGGQGTAISPDRRYVAGIDGFDGNLITVNDLRSGNEVLSRSYQYPENGTAVRWSKDGKWLVWLSGQNIFVWSATEPHADPVSLSLPVNVRGFDLIDHA